MTSALNASGIERLFKEVGLKALETNNKVKGKKVELNSKEQIKKKGKCC